MSENMTNAPDIVKFAKADATPRRPIETILKEKPLAQDIRIHAAEIFHSSDATAVFGAHDEISNTQLIVKVYEEPETPESQNKNIAILEKMTEFNGTAASLVRHHKEGEGLGFPIPYIVDDEQYITRADAETVIQTRVPGSSLMEKTESMSLEATQKAMKNVLSQLGFVSNLRDGDIPIGYHGDIADKAVIIDPETGEGSLVDWEHSFNKKAQLKADLLFCAPEVSDGYITDEGVEPHRADAYAIGGVIARMLLGEKDFYDCLIEKNDRRPDGRLSGSKVRDALRKKGIPNSVASMVRNLLRRDPDGRLVGTVKELNNQKINETPETIYASIGRVLLNAKQETS